MNRDADVTEHSTSNMRRSSDSALESQLLKQHQSVFVLPRATSSPMRAPAPVVTMDLTAANLALQAAQAAQAAEGTDWLTQQIRSMSYAPIDDTAVKPVRSFSREATQWHKADA